ncbi:MAG: anhydro-N-acetylmuramic acid kinase [Gammaproteobacteria bacterium]|nr:anhydro-N-acetylmuramic acid kinase [Gammaproteobacteria bacterium]
MYYVGLMSGTSADAIDAALVDISGDSLEVLDYRQYPLDTDIQRSLRDTDLASSIEKTTELDVRLGRHFGQAVLALLEVNAITAQQVRAIGSHGQTIMHLPGATPPRTLQIGDPNQISGMTRITTVADFRRADVAAGGQGAPLAPAFHAWRFRSPSGNRIVLNIGGIANITVLPASGAGEVTGFDTGPGNILMDAWVQRCLNRDFDDHGQWAASGKVREDLIKLMLADGYFSAPHPKSTGKDDFNLAWLASLTEKTGAAYSNEDIQKTLLELTAASITNAILECAPETDEILTCGGGIHNNLLMERLQGLLPAITIKSTADYGVNPDAVEALSFAWLAQQRLENIPANLPSVTGARRPVILGAIYEPGSIGG